MHDGGLMLAKLLSGTTFKSRAVAAWAELGCKCSAQLSAAAALARSPPDMSVLLSAIYAKAKPAVRSVVGSSSAARIVSRAKSIAAGISAAY